MNYTYPIDAFKTNLESIELIFNQGDNREMIEEELYMDPKHAAQTRTIDVGTVKDDFDGNIISSDDCMLIFKLTTTYIDPSNFKGRRL